MNFNYVRLTPVYKKKLIKHRKTVTLSFLVLLVVVAILHIQSWPAFMMELYYWRHPEQDVACHSIKGTPSLPDVGDFHPKAGKSIFFHETSCNSYLNGKIVINARQACAVESAAFTNPNRDIYLLYASPGNYIPENIESDRLLSVLMNYTNVKILHVDLKRYLSGTPLEQLWTSGRIRYSQYALPHTSDVLRYVTLWKYGGIYLDLDVVVIKNLDDLGSNYAGVESEKDVAAGILSFGVTTEGRNFANMAIEDLAQNFRGDDWGWNGPGTITRLIKKLCNAQDIKNVTGKNCQGFTTYPVSEFYAVPFWKWEYFCSEDALKDVLSLTKDSHIIHVWNKFSSKCKIPLHSNSSYLYFAKKFCPNVVKTLEGVF